MPGGRHESTFAAVNQVARRLDPGPEFICFLGDEVIGLTTDAETLRAQWRHWLDVETAWIDRDATPVYHTTSNHTTYDEMSERVFAEVLGDLPRNGPAGQEGLSYWVRRDDLLMVFVHTSSMALGGEGHVETDWLARTLEAHADARHKLVLGHHPVFPVNGFSGPYQREIGPEYAEAFWDLLVRHGVTAYLCSHILAFDVQVQHGVLQVTTAGAGTAHRMPEEQEYLHLVQMTLDDQGLRYQVIDDMGAVRETLEWPPRAEDLEMHRITAEPGNGSGRARVLVQSDSVDGALPAFWIGLAGPDNRLVVRLSPEAGRSPHSWFGPPFPAGRLVDIEVALHKGMGPGGVLWRDGPAGAWTSLSGASAWGPERLDV